MSIGSGNGLAPNRWQAITWTSADPVHWRIYAALGGDVLNKNCSRAGRQCVWTKWSTSCRLFQMHFHERKKKFHERKKKIYSNFAKNHYNDVIMGTMASQIIRLTIVYVTVYSGADQRNIKSPHHWPLCRVVNPKIQILCILVFNGSNCRSE